MGARRSLRPLVVLTALIGAALVGAAGVQAELLVKGDTAAWAELYAAFKKLAALSTYRMKITSSVSTSTVIEVVQPNAYHSISRITLETGARTHELMNVNGQIRDRVTGVPGVPSGWQCSQGSPPDFGEPFADFQGTVVVSRGPDTVVEGKPVRTYVYLYTQSGQARTEKHTAYVGTKTGLPRRMVTATTAGDLTGITDYYDYGAKIEITLPPCG